MSAASTFPGLSTIGQISITVHDLPVATAFYRDKLRMKHLFDVPGHMSFFDSGGIRLMLAVPEKPEYDHPSSIIYFTVGDIGAAHAALVRSGVEFEREPTLVAPMKDHDLWMAFFRDCDRNLLALMSEVPRA